ncbi:MAG: recombinase RecA [Candidatus Syntrophoarchaeum caldarius]|uniref:Recombinase RecA n=1 Tax=Candidatus Syntropharchaeum caldarium TaxID=1838285 RepID=A0A1F2PAN4_9EURY|nr:MAG: recombinase RecA [Candidatus Syntrophoarchaeum caldarius]
MRDAGMLKPTGIYMLDTIMRGGFPAGSLIYFRGDPDSMAEIFLYQFTSSRKTYYITTTRRHEYIAQNIATIGCTQNMDSVIFLDVYSKYNLNGGYTEDSDEKIMDWIEVELETIKEVEGENEFNIIVDTFSFFMDLKIDQFRLRNLVNRLYELVKGCGGLGFLYVLNDSHDKQIENYIMNVADVIFNVDLERVGHRINNRFSITKVRGMAPLPEFIKFKIGPHGIEIDTSRDIA